MGQVRSQGTKKKKNHTGHCAHTADSTNVKVQNTFHVRNNITGSRDCKYGTAATLYTLECNCKH